MQKVVTEEVCLKQESSVTDTSSRAYQCNNTELGEESWEIVTEDRVKAQIHETWCIYQTLLSSCLHSKFKSPDVQLALKILNSFFFFPSKDLKWKKVFQRWSELNQHLTHCYPNEIYPVVILSCLIITSPLSFREHGMTKASYIQGPLWWEVN